VGLLIVVVVLLLALAVWKSGTMAKTMSAASSDEQELFRSAAGSTAKFVAEITEVSAQGRIKSRLLRKRTEEVYARTASEAIVQSNEHTQIVMGNLADVQSGAVMQVTGTVRKDHAWAAEQIVILTGYVKVQER
jgi:Tfp pilus assembly protein PilX